MKHSRSLAAALPLLATVAHVAIGAARALDAQGGLTDVQCDHFGGEVGLMDDIIQPEPLALLDTLAMEAADSFGGVFAYDVAEAYGQEVARALLAGRTYDPREIAQRLVQDCVGKTGAESPDICKYIEAAQQHGADDDPDHEVGDLQEYLRVAFGLLTPEQQAAFVADSRVRETFVAALGDEDAEDATETAEAI